MFRFIKNICNKTMTSRFFCTKPETTGVLPKLRYSEAENNKILTSLNDLDIVNLSKFVSKSRAERIKSYQKKNGKISNVDEILEISGFGPKIIEKMCDNMLKEQNVKSDEATEQSSANKTKQYSTPKLHEDIAVKMKSCVGLCVMQSGISWAKITYGTPMKLTELAEIDIPERAQLPDLVLLTKHICSTMPTADAYVLEMPQSIQPTIPGKNVINVNVNITRSQLVAMTALGAAHKDQESIDRSDQKVFFLKNHLPARLFRIYIGKERVSTKDAVEEILRYQYKQGAAADQINASEHCRKVFASTDGFKKDHLGQAFLTALAFARICVQKDEKSLDILLNKKAATD